MITYLEQLQQEQKFSLQENGLEEDETTLSLTGLWRGKTSPMSEGEEISLVVGDQSSYLGQWEEERVAFELLQGERFRQEGRGGKSSSVSELEGGVSYVVEEVSSLEGGSLPSVEGGSLFVSRGGPSFLELGEMEQVSGQEGMLFERGGMELLERWQSLSARNARVSSEPVGEVVPRTGRI
ncbi:MAG: hypothetical protein R3Y07_05230, partial [Eubacteriales bacterium]